MLQLSQLSVSAFATQRFSSWHFTGEVLATEQEAAAPVAAVLTALVDDWVFQRLGSETPTENTEERQRVLWIFISRV
jgi:hypothetical protein